jgi:hypothetical protein
MCVGRSLQLDESNRYVAKGHGKAAHEAERAAFMRGDKLVAIISEAASIVRLSRIITCTQRRHTYVHRTSFQLISMSSLSSPFPNPS